ncbi:hypothetical protein [Sulfoacidibacillus thermotolerans]|uniref:Uncharacterized protein n=1 Tax=Sulfoacidibacillus thermotolerans TaxID=1765684 RepID=A0A2U3D7C2_SULT2|nr:hypothetical protein [Sulfoacidibacillus thermotolerans]PWI57179.1 hypothetical protein BM613_09935 [Sulfoacidibacillus thermotolerans]
MNDFDLFHFLQARREAIALQFVSHRHLPRRLQKTIGVLIFLFVSSLTLSGGVFLLATFMHVIVTRLDMPGSLPLSTYTIAQARLVQSQPSRTELKLPQHPASRSLQAMQQAQQQISTSVPSVPVTLIRRPTLGDVLDQWIAHSQNPADAYVQEDAVDMGLYLQREVHQWLLGIFDRATRKTSLPTVQPAGIPLTNGQ